MITTTAQFGVYSDSVLSDPSAVDALEVHGVTEEPDGKGGTICEVDDENPQFYSVYAHLRRGGIDCIGDFPTRKEAEAHARSIASEHGWRVW